jgi:DNA-binding MarR family transcriptional regulator
MNKNQPLPSDAPGLPWDHPRFRSWIAVARACQLMQTVLTRELTSLDIKPTHLDILINLFRFEGISQQELARKLLVGRSNMSMTLPQMEKRGLIERRGDKQDKRVLRLYLTDEGRSVTQSAMVIQTSLIERTLSEEPLDQCMAMAESMERLVARLHADFKDEAETA